MIDNRTLTLCLILIPLVYSVFFFFGSSRKQEKLFTQIVLVNFFFGAGFAFLLTQQHLCFFFGIILANTFIFASFLLSLWVSLKIYEIKPPRWLFLSSGSIHLLGFLYFTYVHFSTLSRIFIIFGQIFLILLYGGIVLLRISTQKAASKRPIAASLLFGSVIFLVRFILAFKWDRNITSIFSPDFAVSFSLLGSAAFILSWNLAVQIKRNTLFHLELKKSLGVLHKTQKDISMLDSMYQHTDEEKTIQNLFQKIFLIIEERFQFHHMAIILKPDEEETLELAAFHNTENEIITFLQDLEISESLSGRVIRSGNVERVMISEYPDSSLKTVLQEKGYRNLIVYPLSSGFENIGVFTIGIKEDAVLSSDDEETLSTICHQLGTLIFNYRHYEKLSISERELRHQASTDPLTGIPNRREFMRRLAAEFGSARRYGDSLSLFMMDLDDFKKINDTYGHMAGDEVLSKVGRLLMKQMRESDLYGRYGGEEFIGVFTRTSLQQAEVIIKRLLEGVRNLKVEGADNLKPTASVGLCELAPGKTSPNDLIKLADEALYKAKQKGKDNYVIDLENQ